MRCRKRHRRHIAGCPQASTSNDVISFGYAKLAIGCLLLAASLAGLYCKLFCNYIYNIYFFVGKIFHIFEKNSFFFRD